MRMSCTPQDEYLIPAMKDEALRRGLTLSALIEEYCREGLKAAHPYYIIAYYDDGTSHRESEFVSYPDLAMSIRAYRELLGQRLHSGKTVQGYRVYSHGKMIEEGGSVPPAQ